jgi:hypothetical protein
MRGANAYQPLQHSHDLVDAPRIDLPGLRYEPLRNTQHELDDRLSAAGPTQGEGQTASSIDAVEARRAALDRELNELRGGSAPSPQRGPDKQTDIDRALALGDDQPAPRSATERGSQENHIAPRQWTESGGMVEQQASAREWHNQIMSGRSRQEVPPPANANDLSREDLQLLEAARSTEAQSHEQELAQAHVRDYPAP